MKATKPSTAVRHRRTQLAHSRGPMTPLSHNQDITSWPQLLGAIEDAEGGRGAARLTEICLSVYSALGAAQFQITQLKARVHVLATRGSARTVIP